MSNSSTIAWHPEPQTRGTTGLVWSCLATMFICTWSALHPNVPSQTSSVYERASRQAGYVVCGVLAPEWLVFSALGNLEEAGRVRGRSPKWSLKRSFFLCMGGIAIRKPDGTTDAVTHVRPLDLLELFEKGTIPWPAFGNAEIEARSQGDGLVKAIALIQLVWFVAQVIARAAGGLAITTLELFTLSNVLCTIVTYIVWWEKPNGVRAPIVIEGVVPDSTPTTNGAVSLIDVPDPGLRNRMVALCVSVAFGAIHVVGWNFHFPSRAEQVLWRVCSVGVTVTSVYMPLVGPFEDALDGNPRTRVVRGMEKVLGPRVFAALNEAFGLVMILAVLGLYGFFRLYMFVEMFAALRDVPVSVYKTTQWTQYIPALG